MQTLIPTSDQSYYLYVNLIRGGSEQSEVLELGNDLGRKSKILENFWKSEEKTVGNMKAEIGIPTHL